MCREYSETMDSWALLSLGPRWYAITHISLCLILDDSGVDDGDDDLRRSIAAGARAGPEYAPQPARHDRLSPLECHLVSVARVAAVSGSFGKPSLASWWPYIALIVRHTQRELGGLTKNHFSLTHRMLPTEPNVIKRFNSLVSLSLSLSIPQSISQSTPNQSGLHRYIEGSS